MSRHPEIKWAQRKEKVYLTVLLPDSKNAKVNLEPEGTFTFSAQAGADNNQYELKLDLFDKVNVEESKINIGPRSVFCVVEKVEKEWWKKLLRGDGKAPHYVKVDWDKWVDEDDDGGVGDLDLGGMDLSNFGGMGGMGGMEGLGGMAGMGGLGGMAGMGGLGGMGGMGGLDGMGGDFDESDEEEVEKPENQTADKAQEVSKAEDQQAGKEEAKAESQATA